ncbi:hypothetical protein GCM10010331_11240 [Streptomyces xanthochromogenes]|nr:hypothetical protein GCM10010331_11240 [Streptomyces xanthochromogenes]
MRAGTEVLGDTYRGAGNCAIGHARCEDENGVGGAGNCAIGHARCEDENGVGGAGNCANGPRGPHP